MPVGIYTCEKLLFQNHTFRFLNSIAICCLEFKILHYQFVRLLV